MPPPSERVLKQAEATSTSRAELRYANDTEWERARRESLDLRQILDRKTSSLEIARLAKKWVVSRATVFRRLSRLRETGDMSALLPRRRGQKLGSSHLEPEVEFIIRDCAKRLWGLSENATVDDILAVITRECRARQLRAPSHATVGRRLQKLRLDPENFSGEARRALRDSKRLVKSNYQVGECLSVVQIDHTVADILLVEPHTHSLIGRPTLTVAVDVATRCVLGFCLSLEAPSSLLVALCLEMAVFPKDWLRDPGVQVDWPMYGLMKAIHTDNGREFHGQAFRRGCDLNGIEMIYRPPATPRFGGHIERLIGTFMRRTRLLPGNTYSDMLGRRPRYAEAAATLTLQDYAAFLTQEIDRYHSRVHRILGTSPKAAWERCWKRSRGVEVPPVPNSRERFLLDFLPCRTRVVTREGIEIDGLRFSDGSLESEVNPRVKRVVRIDPRDISRVYLETHDGPYLTIPLRASHNMPKLSWWEWKGLRRRQRQDRAGAAQGPEKTALRAGRSRARKAEWKALQAIQALPPPKATLRPLVVSGDADSALPDWEILE